MHKQIVRRDEQAKPALLEAGLSPLLARIYSSRGVERPDQLDNSLKGLLPFHTMRDIEPAAELIAEAIEAGQRLLVVGDFDCDGATSSALAVSALRALGAQWAGYLVPNRFEYGYGLSPEIVAVAEQQQPDLLITVDNGISSVAGVRAAKEAGIKVVVTDHHLPGDELPEADALVNPNQHGCDFVAKNTCGVGVIWYVMTAVCRRLQTRGWFERRQQPVPNMADFLDLVALGTVADVVPLDHNNRILVDQGLKRIRAGRCRPGIKALAEIASRQLDKLVATDLGFAIGPRLNAAGRLEDMSIGIECLLSRSEPEARALALQLDELNQDRKQIEQQMQRQALKILDQISLDDETELPYGVCLFEPDWHEGVIGILASRIKERLHRPVIAFAEAEGGMIKGSARSIPGLHIRDVLAAVEAREPDLLAKYGGHAMAAGMSLERDKFERFSRAFDAEVRRQLDEEQLQARIESDGAMAVAEMNLEMARQLRDGGPWGQLFPEPLFDGEFELVQQRIVGERHLKLVLAPIEQGRPSGFCIDAIAFNVDLDVWPSQSNRARVAFKLDINEFRGRVSPQLMVDYLEPISE
ncbi:single-stranded-DNA-specific exonuclease RecJ [Motiliproteus coralliicola]|uniref:Single-stranded-DNA-specific exonuclease RecJ n=1 Tax=Motiliproteus coralliicola TaxID=2283196 RepID=A0A369WKE6_9GAMM|nr:single-stranded-DNA-specific exonuclease RecJ [Motiliproteus coralliicola]RDE22528.1 single-stranded-DNA-specific exonuclease RecJ [Motiliproteus coralliicola]